MNTNEKLELLKKAKDAYYNSGEEILTDIEYDQLEEELGLENQTEIGSHSINYTIKHPYIMGSLSKVQIKEENHTINWEKYVQEIWKYTGGKDIPLIITPKYDGCSFEVLVENFEITQISTRGDGEWGKDIYKHLINKFNKEHTLLHNGNYTLRGEVLINKHLFQKSKYVEKFANPRSFVSGLLNRDFEENNEEFTYMLSLLDIVIYDIRTKENDTYIDHDWVNYTIENTPKHCLNNWIIEDGKRLNAIYNLFDNVRKDSDYALDGFVIKPIERYRINNTTRTRPSDCVAVKFLPMIQETEIIDFEWSIKKTNELRPVAIVKPVEMDGKMISRVSAHNYGYMRDNKISIGTKIQVSLAGDIIPFIYKVTDTTNYNPLNIKLPCSEEEVYEEGCHLYKVLSTYELNKMKFLASANVLQIPHVGPATAEAIFGLYDDRFEEISSILHVCNKEGLERIFYGLGGGKSAENVVNSIRTFLEKLTMVDVIQCQCFLSCGKVASELCARIMSDLEYDTTGINYEAYAWALDNSSKEYNQVVDFMTKYNIKYLTENKTTSDKIKVILTGSPADITEYKTKSAWLIAHPQYEETTKWNECKILFTNDTESNSSKNKKAQKLNIEIKLYED